MRRSKIVIMLLAVCAMAGIASANLLSNGNFNDPDSTAAPTDWNIWTYGGGWANHQNTNIPFDGSYFMAVGGSSDAGAGLYQIVAGTEGVEYTLTVEAGAQAWWKPLGEMKMFFLDSSDAEISSVIAVTADPPGYDIQVDWHSVSLTAIAPVGTTQVKVELACASGQGTVWFDNAVLVPEPATLVILGLGGLLLRRKK
ncbi:MAG: PEP-CTERM sorting domain-containing protein [Phycisphaerae bacterium]